MCKKIFNPKIEQLFEKILERWKNISKQSLEIFFQGNTGMAT